MMLVLLSQLSFRLPVCSVVRPFCVRPLGCFETAGGVVVMQLWHTVFCSTLTKQHCAAACTASVVCLLCLLFAGIEPFQFPKFDTPLICHGALMCKLHWPLQLVSISVYCTIPYHTTPHHTTPHHTIPYHTIVELGPSSCMVAACASSTC